jgi:3-phenylpropionate/cinnamic acid dioxygenase small subunit
MPEITGSWEDREQIRELYARYALYIDGGKFEDWVSCFTEDGIFESRSLGKHTGHAALRKFCASYKESWGGAQVRHMMVNVSFDVHDDHAHGTCNLIYFHIKAGKTELTAVGGYRDELRKVNGNWQFAHRQVFVDK